MVARRSLPGSLLQFALVAATAGAPAAVADPITIDFATIAPAGDFGSPTFIDDSTGLAADGLYFRNSLWQPANLYVRNQTNDHGFGVCNPRESPCPGPSGGGDINELDNKGPDELIRLTLPVGYEWVSVQLSSLDDNDGDGFEYGQLWADLDGDPVSLDTVLWQFRGDGSTPTEPVFIIPEASLTAPYLFFQPFDWKENETDNNDFLVYAATIEQTERTPEPGSIAVLGIGLVALRLLRRRTA